MIELEILTTTDHDKRGKYKFYFNHISIGNDINQHIYLLDDYFKEQSFSFSIVDNKLYCDPQNKERTFHINKKLTSSKKIIKPHDIIEVGQTIIKISSFNETKLKTKNEYLKEKVATLPETNPELVELMQKLNL